MKIKIFIGCLAGMMIAGSAFAQRHLDRCGDGTCDQVEQRLGRCPQDCQEGLAVSLGLQGKRRSIAADSLAFGFSGMYDLSYADLGFGSLRLGGPLGAVIWERGFAETDRILKTIYDNRFEIASGIQGGNPVAEKRLEEYADFVKAAAERYDGDGIADAPGSPKVAYWEIDNEPDLYTGQRDAFRGWDPKANKEAVPGEAAQYALMLKTAYKAIKSASPEAKVAIGAMALSLDYYEKILQRLEELKEGPEERFFDAFNYHNYGEHDNYGRIPAPSDKMQGGPAFDEVKALLEKYGYTDTEIIITETGTFSGLTRVGEQSEKEQAINLVKRFVYPVSRGVSRVYWFNIKNRGQDIFDKMALVEDGNKKLAYYTYKLLAEKLDASQWGNVETVRESDNVHVYKFIKSGLPVYVAWRDYFNGNTGTKTITLNIGGASSVEITEAVPRGEFSFNTEIKAVENGQVTIALEDAPVFIEPKIFILGQGPALGHSVDADGFIWGTEIKPDELGTTEGIINNTLRTKYLKVRLGIDNVSMDGKSFSSAACFPSAANCQKHWDIGEVARIFNANGWSMVPMLSFGYHGVTSAATPQDMEKYVDFIDWFVSTYKETANIKYLELENCPNCAASLKISAQLLVGANNRIYDRIKQKFPDVLVGTAGFEFWIDQPDDEMAGVLDYFLDKDNGVKFDFFAFHGYAMSEKTGRIAHLPPTKTASYSKYAGITGIANIRKKLDANGWQDRLVIDTEHGTIFPGPSYSSEEEQVDAAYYLQELLLKRVQEANGRLALAGIFPLKIRMRVKLAKGRGGLTSGDLDSSGSAFLSVEAVSLLWSKLKDYHYAAHVSGKFDNEAQAWVEKFQKGTKELYIYFKPFKYQRGLTVGFDHEKLIYRLILNKLPVSVILTDISGRQKAVDPSQELRLEAENAPKFLEIEYP